jgi:hypothetical protein
MVGLLASLGGCLFLLFSFLRGGCASGMRIELLGVSHFESQVGKNIVPFHAWH